MREELHVEPKATGKHSDASVTRGNLLDLMHRHLPPAEQVILTKMLLEQHVLPLSDEEFACFQGPLWAKTWLEACRASDWNLAKTTLLFKSTLIISEAGKSFLDCALVVVAERLAMNLLVKIHDLAEGQKPLAESTILEARHFRVEVLSIFESFNDREVKPSWDVLVYNMVNFINVATSFMDGTLQNSIVRGAFQREQETHLEVVKLQAENGEVVSLRSELKQKQELAAKNRALQEENILLISRLREESEGKSAVIEKLKNRAEQQEILLAHYRQAIASDVRGDVDEMEHYLSVAWKKGAVLDRNQTVTRRQGDSVAYTGDRDVLFPALDWD